MLAREAPRSLRCWDFYGGSCCPAPSPIWRMRGEQTILSLWPPWRPAPFQEPPRVGTELRTLPRSHPKNFPGFQEPCRGPGQRTMTGPVTPRPTCLPGAQLASHIWHHSEQSEGLDSLNSRVAPGHCDLTEMTCTDVHDPTVRTAQGPALHP